MAGVDLGTVLRRLRRFFDRPGYPTPTDAEVLARFLAERDEAAFELLVWRHGPAVLGLCRRMLRREQDAEDAFQATFLTLARRAGAIGRRQSVGSWLFKVAYRVALRARERAGRAAVLPLAGQPEPAGQEPERPDPEVRSLLDEEVSRLPDKYRAAVVLCYLQGKTNTEAARELGCPRGTIDSRLAWARQRLRQRLVRRGITLSIAGLVAVLAPSGGFAAVPAALVPATSHLALQFASRGAALAGLASVPSVQLAQGVLRAMLLAKLKTTLAVVLAVAAVATGSWGTFRAQDRFAPPQPPAVEVPAPADPQPPSPPAEPEGETWAVQAKMRGHLRTVVCVAFSPDGKRLASGSRSRVDNPGELCLWDAATGKMVANHATERGVASVAFSPDGRFLATAEPGQTPRLREAGTGKVLDHLRPTDTSVDVVAFSPDGKLLATGNTDKDVRLWAVAEPATAKPIRTLTGRVDSLAFSPDGRRLATAGPDGVARLWDVATGKEIAELRGKQVAFAPDGKAFVTAGADRIVRMWDVATGTEVRIFQAPMRRVLCVTFAPDGKTLAVSGGTEEENAEPPAGEILLWDAATGRLLANLRGHTERVNALAFSPDGKRLASASGDGTVILWRRQGQAVVRPPVPRADNLVSDRLDQLLSQLLKSNRTDEQIAESLYLATIGRLPTDGEKARFARLQRERPDARQQTFEQLLGALTASPECQAHLESLQKRTGRRPGPVD